MRKETKFIQVNAYLLVSPQSVMSPGNGGNSSDLAVFKPDESKFTEELHHNSIVRIGLDETGLEFVGATEHKLNESLDLALIFPREDGYWCRVTILGRVVSLKVVDEGLNETGIEFMPGMSQAAEGEIAAFLLANRKEMAKVQQFDAQYAKNIAR